jgi:hypothetical protein
MKETVMFRLLLVAAALFVTACHEATPDTPFVSEAIAAPAQAPDYGWRTSIDPNARDGAVMDYE